MNAAEGLYLYLAVEVDGHQWHEATQHQVQNDKSRDRKLTAAGWQVLRFTGSEVYRAPAACVREVREPIIRKRTARVAG
jgi:very-short-patch-repair endonuclease